jgi:hypothetical protein
MIEQLETNTDASADVSAMEGDNAMQQVTTIATLFQDTFQQLIAIRDVAYANAIGDLERESEALAKEHAQLQTAIHDIEATLPAKTRLTQHEVDVLLVSGKPDAKQDVKAKMDELKELQRKPALLRQRQKEITSRSDAIASEKEAIARTVFEHWLKVVRPVVRAGEHGLFITLLGGLERSFYEFQSAVGLTKLNNRTRPLVSQDHIVSLTSDGRSEEYAAGRHWYR